MTVVKELIRSELDGTLSFGDYTLDTKTKKDGFEFQGDIYKVKTFKEITKLEKNGMFVYESVPGTAVMNLNATDTGLTFQVEGPEDAQITVEMEPDTEYEVFIEQASTGKMKTNLGGKLSFSCRTWKCCKSRSKNCKMLKNKKTVYFCQECGYESAKWMGQCPGCKAWNTFVEETVSTKKSSSSGINEIIREKTGTGKSLRISACLRMNDRQLKLVNLTGCWAAVSSPAPLF